MLDASGRHMHLSRLSHSTRRAQSTSMSRVSTDLPSRDHFPPQLTCETFILLLRRPVAKRRFVIASSANRKFKEFTMSYLSRVAERVDASYRLVLYFDKTFVIRGAAI
jgi:hypothetical protein